MLWEWASHQTDDQAVRVGIEGSANFGAGLTRFLRGHDVDVREVPAKLTGRERSRLRRPGKTDPTDALTIARVTACESDLPPARHNTANDDLKVLVDAREELVVQRTAEANRLHADLAICSPATGGNCGPSSARRQSTEPPLFYSTLTASVPGSQPPAFTACEASIPRSST